MKGGITLVVIGAIVGIFGFIFHLQGLSVVGPESSFMYANPNWVTYGMQIMILGTIILIAGIIVAKKTS